MGPTFRVASVLMDLGVEKEVKRLVCTFKNLVRLRGQKLESGSCQGQGAK